MADRSQRIDVPPAAAHARPGPTIGVIMDHVAGESRSSLWPGIADTVQAHGGNLLCFAGGYLVDPEDFQAQGNIIYELIDTAALDGLIIWSSSLASYVGLESLRRFCDRYRPLPIVSIGSELEGIPGILLDSYGGMRQAMTHLIRVHGRRRLAFIRGPQGHRDADERYRAYLDVLQEQGLTPSADLISPPYKWFDSAGHDMMRLLFDERRVAFDAVVCVNDASAVEAMEVLQARGIRVPEDVSVVGFNDSALCTVVTPPLTTVPWRMYERGQYAAQLLLDRIAGKSVPDRVLLPASLIVRQSCGCLDPSVAQAQSLDRDEIPKHGGAKGHEEREAPMLLRDPDTLRAHCLAAIEQAVEEKERLMEWPAQLLDAFLGELARPTERVFLLTLDRILRQVAARGGEAAAWQKAISALRGQLLPAFGEDDRMLARAEDLWHAARVMIGEQAQRAAGHVTWSAQRRTERLRRISHVLVTASRIPDLMDVLAAELPLLGIPRCYLALYEEPAQPDGWCRVELAFDENGRRELSGSERRVRGRALAYGSLAPAGKPYSLLVQPLYFRDEQFGLVVFEQQTDGDIYEMLREEISVTLKAVLLAERNEQLYRQALAAEQSAQQGRLLAEEADRLKSRFLSMVSHELRTPLVLLVGLSEMMLRERSERTGEGRPPLPEPYRQDLARIHVSAQQLDSLVRDVLDLTRSQMGQLRLVKEMLDLGQVLRPVALVGEQMAASKGLDWRVEIPEQLPKVYGDPARLRQVAFNLVTNAVKFTARGYVQLEIAAGDDTLTVSVSDTGLGVPQAEQEAIFDEFRQSERVAARGYGGLGIGLAICRELVELHGGQIGVRSSGEEENGSTFYFTLPIVGDQPVEETGRQASSQAVVLLTSEARSGERLAEYLTREGFQVESLCFDGVSDWLGRLSALAPGAVILDCEPASARGWQVIEALREHPATQEIPVLFFALQESNTGAMLALSHLTKPVDTAALAHALQRYGLAAEAANGVKTILIVDDDPSILELHTRVVRSALANGRVLQAADGKSALQIMRSERPSLVLLDLMMPELDGLGVLAAMQEDERLRGIPVIVVTAQTLTQKEMERLNRGVAAVLQKGLFTTEETLAHIENALARNKRLGSEAQRTVRKAMAYIHEHYAEPISREEIASYIGVSARHLTRCFQQEVGLSPITYLSRYRVERAKQLLEFGALSITEVAGATGFASSSYFTDAFRREVGLSPRDYQRRVLVPKS